MTATAVFIAAAMIVMALGLAMTLAWRVWFQTRNASWIDVAWTIAVGAAGFVAAFVPLGAEPRRGVLIAAAVAAWTVRLAPHLIARTRVHSDDPRYHAQIRHWGAGAPVRMFGVCMVRALWGVPLVLAVRLAAHNATDPLGLRDAIGTALVFAGIVGAALADRQLHHFREHSGGAVCERGLWRYSRHPNYFFEFLVGARIRCSPSRSERRGDGSRLLRPSPCICFSCTSPAYRLSRSTCYERAATPTKATSPAPVRSCRCPVVRRRRAASYSTISKCPRQAEWWSNSGPCDHASMRCVRAPARRSAA